MAWMYAPFVNSYKRYQLGSWAPTAILWSHDNRTCGFRVVGEHKGYRVESRLPGGDVNPYSATRPRSRAAARDREQGRARRRSRGTPTSRRTRARAVVAARSVDEMERSEVMRERSATSCSGTC